MAVPRPILLALVGVVLAAGAFLATRNSQDTTSSSPSTPAKQSATPAQPASKPHAPSAQSVASRAQSKASHARAKRAARAHAKTRAQVAAVERAIARHRTVVLFLYQPGAADDEKTAEAVRSLRRHSKAKVFSDTVSHVGRYGPIVGTAGVTQAPSVVIVDKKRRAHLVEGYVDPETLAQEVADSK